MSDIIARYSMGSAAPTTNDTDIVASSLTNGSLSTFNANQTGVGYSSSPTLTVAPPTTTTNVPSAITNNSYFQFTLTPNANRLLRLESIAFNIARSSASGARGFSIRSSLDNYSSDILTQDVLTSRTTFTAIVAYLTANPVFQSVASAITFRIYIYGPGTGTSLDIDDIVVNGNMLFYGTSATVSTSKRLVKEIAELCENAGIGLYAGSPTTRTIFTGELPDLPPAITSAIWLVEAPSPPPHEYIDTEYPVIDFWARSPKTATAHALLELVYNTFHRKYSYDTANWHIAFSRALGNIVDVDRDGDNGKLFRLSVQFICRNLNNIS